MLARLARTLVQRTASRAGDMLCAPPRVAPHRVLVRSLFSMKGGPRHELKAYAKEEMLRSETPEDVRRIWLQYHNQKNCISAVVPMETAKTLSDRLEESPDFVLPLPLINGEAGEYAVMYQQSMGNVVQYTSVHEYNTYREHAMPFLNVYFYDELAESKGLVLLRGDVNMQKMTVEQAQMLLNHVQIYYLSSSHYRFAQLFNKSPQDFDFQMLLLNTRAILSGHGQSIPKVEISKASDSKADAPAATAAVAEATPPSDAQHKA